MSLLLGLLVLLVAVCAVVALALCRAAATFEQEGPEHGRLGDLRLTDVAPPSGAGRPRDAV